MNDAEQNNTPSDEAGTQDFATPGSLSEGSAVSPPPSSSPVYMEPSLPPDPPSRAPRMLGIAAVLIILLLILGSLTPLRDVVLSRFAAPTATPLPTVVPGDDQFYIRVSPAWGTITIDGRTLTRLPALYRDAPLRLPVGRHQITWQARPFLSQSCSITVPSQLYQETCKLEVPVQLPSGATIRVITFSASLNLLPDDQRSALIKQTQVALDALQSSDTVQPGELYARLQGNAQTPSMITATQPLQAIQHFRLDTNPGADCLAGCRVEGQDCHLFCAMPQVFLPPQGAVAPASTPTASLTLTPPQAQPWTAMAVDYITWDYKTLSGQTVAHDQPDTATTGGISDHGVGLQVRWDGTNWHATLDNGLLTTFADPACLAPFITVFSSRNYLLTTQNTPHVSVSWNFVAGANRAAGCLGLALPMSSFDATPVPGARPVAFTLYRFGILLAADSRAHNAWPTLPMADANEQGIAQQIAARYKV